MQVSRVSLAFSRPIFKTVCLTGPESVSQLISELWAEGILIRTEPSLAKVPKAKEEDEFMKRSAIVLVVLSLFTLLISGLAVAQDDGTSTPQQPAAQPAYQAPQGAIYRQPGTVIVPQSSVERPEDAGLRAHTNYEIFVPAGRAQSSITPDNTFAESPSSIACVYGVGTKYTGCTPGGGTSANNASGGWGGNCIGGRL